MKNKIFLAIFYFIFALAGIGMIIGGIVLLINGYNFRQSADRINANISRIEYYTDSDGDAHHTVYASYEYKGTAYEDVRLSEYSSTMYEGKDIVLLCDPNNPRHVKTTSGDYVSGGILTGVGVIFAAIGIVPTVLSISKKSKNRKLLREGKVIHGTVESIVLNTSLAINGRNPYIIYCTYYDEYKDTTYRFKSDNLWIDPIPVYNVGDYIDIYVMNDNYENYYVDAETKINEKIVDLT